LVVGVFWRNGARYEARPVRPSEQSLSEEPDSPERAKKRKAPYNKGFAPGTGLDLFCPTGHIRIQRRGRPCPFDHQFHHDPNRRPAPRRESSVPVAPKPAKGCIDPLLAFLSSFASTGDAPHYFIEQIRFNGIEHASETILRAEIHLSEEAAYTERELYRARERLERLPFVYSAEIKLEKGIQKGNYVLVVTIVESKRWIWQLDFDLHFIEEEYFDFETRELASTPDDPQNGLLIGYRHFAGAKNEWTFSFPGAVNWSRYRFLGTKAVAGLAGGLETDLLWRSLIPEDDNLVAVAGKPGALFFQGSLSMPLAGDHWFHLRGHHSDGEVHEITPASENGYEPEGERFQRRILEASWSYNSTDHPLLATRGSALAWGFLDEVEWRDVAFGSENRPFTSARAQNRRIFFRSRHFWQLPREDIFGLETDVEGRHTDLVIEGARNPRDFPEDYTSFDGRLAVLLARNFPDQPLLGWRQDWRAHVRVGGGIYRSVLEVFDPIPDRQRYFVEIGLRGYGPRSIVGFSLTYATEHQELWP